MNLPIEDTRMYVRIFDSTATWMSLSRKHELELAGRRRFVD